MTNKKPVRWSYFQYVQAIALKLGTSWRGIPLTFRDISNGFFALCGLFMLLVMPVFVLLSPVLAAFCMVMDRRNEKRVRQAQERLLQERALPHATHED